ncbi:hypothetical protein OROHE_022165 [Orobanche hederae]
MAQGCGIVESPDVYGIQLPKASQKTLWDMHSRKRMLPTH